MVVPTSEGFSLCVQQFRSWNLPPQRSSQHVRVSVGWQPVDWSVGLALWNWNLSFAGWSLLFVILAVCERCQVSLSMQLLLICCSRYIFYIMPCEIDNCFLANPITAKPVAILVQRYWLRFVEKWPFWGGWLLLHGFKPGSDEVKFILSWTPMITKDKTVLISLL
jgi:hypothetical protein